MSEFNKPAVTSVSKNGSTKLRNDVTLTGGTNVTLTQSGQDISIAATGGAAALGHAFGSSTTASADYDSTTPVAVGPTAALAVATNTNKVILRTSFTYRFVSASSRYLAYFQFYKDSVAITTGILAVSTGTIATPSDYVHSGFLQAEFTPGDTSSHTYQLRMYVDASTVTGGSIHYGTQPQFNIVPVNTISVDEITA